MCMFGVFIAPPSCFHMLWRILWHLEAQIEFTNSQILLSRADSLLNVLERVCRKRQENSRRIIVHSSAVPRLLH